MFHYFHSFISSLFHISIGKSSLRILCCLQPYASNSILFLEHCCLGSCHVYSPMYRITSFLSSSSLFYNFNIKLHVVVCRPPQLDISHWGWHDLPPEHLDPCIGLSLPGWQTIEPSPPLFFFNYVTIGVLRMIQVAPETHVGQGGLKEAQKSKCLDYAQTRTRV